ncbi:MAG: formyltetrahydrofolate deformylase [Verrucomicrobiota bacterium]
MTAASSSPTAILLSSCPDQPGIVHSTTGLIAEHGGNIVHLDQHVDTEANTLFMRIEWTLENFSLSHDELLPSLQPIIDRFQMRADLEISDTVPRAAIFVSKESHCLHDLLSRHESGELHIDIPLIISNHESLKPVADRFDIPFHHFPITPDTKSDQESAELELLRSENIDTVILARYMQILSSRLIDAFPSKIINIHHSFLPAFPGARPYHSAHARGVKIIGATSHYVTEDLDEGPIIAQDVIHVSHRDSVQDLIRRGKDLEKIVLARALWAHTQRRVLVYDNKTIVFR